MATKRVLTGMRTTGQLHLGHYVGALKQWIETQNSGEYDCYFLLADIQALTTHADRPELLTQSVRDVVLDWLSVGLNPTRADVHYVLQSQVPERHELSLLLAMIAKYNELLRNPTLKAEMKEIKDVTLGFICYPVDQVADIYMVSPTPPTKGDKLLVPVGEDQVPHLEYARELARRFNDKYGEVFVPCEALVGEVGRLVGIDGQAKMSKSLNNAIYLADDAETVKAKVMKMFTDPKRIRADIPGETKNNPVFVYHRAFNPDKQEVADLTERYEKGKVGDIEVKEKLAKVLNNFLDPIRERRAHYENTAEIRDIVIAGSEAARKMCKPVIESVREKMHLVYPI
ncbi:MAG: tryptophan--tRNA ligase [Anaerolineales bacterium]